MSKPIVDELNMLEKDGVLLYDAFLQKEVLAVSPVLCITCDNPRASEVTNHMGPGSRKFCRMCMVHIHIVLHTCIHIILYTTDSLHSFAHISPHTD